MRVIFKRLIHIMTKQRYRELELNGNLSLTQEEVKDGWHFCNDFDGMLMNKKWPAYELCTCFYKQQKTAV